jgi:hypothetical protein
MDFLIEKSVHSQGARRYIAFAKMRAEPNRVITLEHSTKHLNTAQNPRTLLHGPAESRDLLSPDANVEPVCMSSNRVSAIKIRILKIRDQRLARETGATLRKIQKSASQRLAMAPLTHGNIAYIFVGRPSPTETGPVG